MYGLYLDKRSTQSLTSQLNTQLRAAILEGRLKCGERLPPTRTLAEELNTARNVVIQAYEQLLAEGYLESRVGSGTYVADLGPQRYIQAKNDLTSSRIDRFDPNYMVKPINFNPGTPDLSLFPRQTWSKLLKEISLDAPDEIWGYGPVEGEPALRKAIADYLYRSKGLESNLNQIVITSGIAQATDLAAHLLYRSGCAIVEEDPSDCFTRHIFIKNGYRIAPIPVDEDGMQTELLPNDPDVRLIYVVPSHQFPIGGILPIRRRLDLIAYARKMDAYIIEDDYDSEFRFAGEPIQPFYQLAPDRVIYMGTFSKTFSPGIRLGFMILPESLKDGLYMLKDQLNLRTPSLLQLAMAEYLSSKSFDRHIYKMKKIYEAKRKHLISSLKETFGDQVQISGENAGLHLLAEFIDRDFCPADFEELKKSGVIVDWVEDYTICEGKHKNRIVLGYGGLSLEEIGKGVKILEKLL